MLENALGFAEIDSRGVHVFEQVAFLHSFHEWHFYLKPRDSQVAGREQT